MNLNHHLPEMGIPGSPETLWSPSMRLHQRLRAGVLMIHARSLSLLRTFVQHLHATLMCQSPFPHLPYSLRSPCLPKSGVRVLTHISVAVRKGDTPYLGHRSGVSQYRMRTWALTA